MIDPCVLAILLAFLSGFLAGEVIAMLSDYDLYAAALACFCAIIIMITSRRIAA